MARGRKETHAGENGRGKKTQQDHRGSEKRGHCRKEDKTGMGIIPSSYD